MNCIALAVEDELSEAIGSKILRSIIGPQVDVRVHRNGGSGYLRSRLNKFLEISWLYPVLMITDLDRAACAPSLRAVWFGNLASPENFVFRIAVREVEAWLLADADNLSEYLAVSRSLIPESPDHEPDPKAALVRVAAKTRNRDLRIGIVPQKGAISKQGLGYNQALRPFVEGTWDFRRAAERSDSLRRTCERIEQLLNRMELWEHNHA